MKILTRIDDKRLNPNRQEKIYLLSYQVIEQYYASILLDGSFQKSLLNDTDIATSFPRKNSITRKD